jgi:hypothetical protein
MLEEQKRVIDEPQPGKFFEAKRNLDGLIQA